MAILVRVSSLVCFWAKCLTITVPPPRSMSVVDLLEKPGGKLRVTCDRPASQLQCLKGLTVLEELLVYRLSPPPLPQLSQHFVSVL